MLQSLTVSCILVTTKTLRGGEKGTLMGYETPELAMRTVLG